MKNGIENGYYHEITPGGYGIAIKAGKVLFSEQSPFQKVEVFDSWWFNDDNRGWWISLPRNDCTYSYDATPKP